MRLTRLLTGLIALALMGLGAPHARAEAGTALAEPPAQGLKVATFAGGCFWCMEPPYDKLDGVVSTTSGYTGGTKPNPTYKEVSAGGTGHTEAVRVVYDPAKIGYPQLLDVFWRNIDPLDATGQFCDKGDEYRPALFTHDAEQARLAEASKEALAASRRFNQPILGNRETPRRVFLPED